MEATERFTKPIDFDLALTIYVYTEPTISITIILIIFGKNKEKLLKSFETLNRICNRLDEIKSPVSLTLLHFLMGLIYFLGCSGVVFWYLGGWLINRLFEAFIKAQCYGIAFYIQNTVMSILFCHMILSFLAFQALNARLRALRKRQLWMSKDDLKKTLKLIGVIHGELCQAHNDILQLCFPTVLLFSLRAGLQFSLLILIVCGIVPKGDTIFFLTPLIVYGGDCFFVALISDTLGECVSKLIDRFFRSDCLFTFLL